MKFTTTILLFILFISFQSCDKSPVIKEVDENCSYVDLENKKEHPNCFYESQFLVCNNYEVKEVKFLENEDFEWMSDFCLEKEEKIYYKNLNQETASFRIVGKDNYIYRSRESIICSKSMEHANIICQKNEIAYIDFLCSKFGVDTIRLELSHLILDVQNEQLGKSNLMLTFDQRRSNTNVANFYYMMRAEGNEFDNRRVIHHSSLMLLGKSYTDLIEIKIGLAYGNNPPPPKQRIYLKKNYGILAFESEKELWVRVE